MALPSCMTVKFGSDRPRGKVSVGDRPSEFVEDLLEWEFDGLEEWEKTAILGFRELIQKPIAPRPVMTLTMQSPCQSVLLERITDGKGLTVPGVTRCQKGDEISGRSTPGT